MGTISHRVVVHSIVDGPMSVLHQGSALGMEVRYVEKDVLGKFNSLVMIFIVFLNTV